MGHGGGEEAGGKRQKGTTMGSDCEVPGIDSEAADKSSGAGCSEARGVVVSES